MARICLVTHVVAPWDGQGRVNYELARHLARQDHAVTLVASVVDPGLLAHPGIRWLQIPVPAWLPDPLQWLAFALLVRARLRRRTLTGFDIVHLHGAIAPIQADLNTCHFVHTAWARVARPGQWGSLLAAAYQRLVTEICAWTERRAYVTARRVVAVSEAVADALRRDVGVPPRRVRVIYNGVDPTEFRPHAPGEPRPLRDSLRLPADAFLVAFVGDARSPRKNLDLALRTLAHLDPQFHLAVIGETRGGSYPVVAERLGVGARTHFLGARRDVAASLREMDALVCLSHYEPASLVLLEAMASGLPVICTPGVGNAPFVDHGVNGFRLRGPDDYERAVWLLQALARDRRLAERVGQAARDSARRLEWERMGRQYEAVYEELMTELSPALRSEGSLAPGAALRSLEGRA